MKLSTSDTFPTVDVFALARSGRYEEGSIAVELLKRLTPLLATPTGTVQWRLQGMIDALGRPAATLSLRADLTVNCDKCALPLALPFEITEHYWFVRSEEELQRLPIDTEEEEPLVGSSTFQIVNLVEDELILALPISPRHPQRVPGASNAAH